MVIFNNKEMEIYDLDSENSILNRLTANLKTLPEFLYFPDGIPTLEQIYENKNINVIDLIPIIENSNNLKEVYEYMKDENKIFKKSSFYMIVYYYIVLNNKIRELLNYEEEYLDIIKVDKLNEIIGEIKEININENITYESLNQILNRIDTNKNIIDRDIKKNEDNWNPDIPNNSISSFKKFQEEKEIKYTDFDQEKLKFQIEIELKNIISILEVFNVLKLNKNVPFATTQKFYKILKNFTPPLEWSNLFDKSKSFVDRYKNIDRNKNIIFKILENEKKQIYSEGILTIKDKKISITLEYNIKNISKGVVIDDYTKTFIDKFLMIFDQNINKNIPINIIDISGIFYFPLQTMDKYVLLDLIANNKLFSSLIGVNEKQLSKKDSVYIYFENTKIGKITATITPKIVQKINIDKENFPLKSNYIRVKINKANNIEKVKYFQQILAKLFNIYNKNVDEIVEIYSPFVKLNIIAKDEEDDDIEEKNKLENIEPQVFKRGYSSDICQKKTKPAYITEEEAEILISEGRNKNIMKFPKEETDGILPRYYFCNTEEYPYPGLKNNKLSNSDVFPYLPCCYPGDQTSKPKYRDYYFGEEIKKKESKSQNIYITGKIINDKEHAYLPENINKMFYIADKTSIYYRRGVPRNQSSFLSCVLIALRKDYSNVNFIRTKKLAKLELASSCKQEMYNYNLVGIMEKIKNTEEYFDPKLFLHLLEVEYDCNIFIFTSDDNGKLIVPNHIKGYYKMKNNKKCIFIYEHTGSKADKALYPQCELIIRQLDEKMEETEDIFEFNNPVSKNIFEIFNKLNYSYILDNKITFKNINWPWKNVVLLSQVIDSYGKTRVVNIEYEKNKISILTTPIQPLKLIETKDIYKTSISTALEVVRQLNIKDHEQLIDKDNFINEIIGKIGNVDIKILIEENSIIEFKNSAINIYNKYKKLSRYIVEYMFWLFSTYLHANKINKESIDEEVYKNFKDKYIQINNEFNYENIPKLFSMNNSGIMLNNKLIVKSEDTLKRLFYVLRLMLIRNENKLLSYYLYTVIENYYNDITDFEEYQNQIILEGESSISKLINEKNNKNKVYNNVNLYIKEKKDEKIEDEEEEEVDDEEEIEEIHIKKIDKFSKNWNIKPYFFKNKLINNNEMYIAQNIDSYLKGINIALTWINEKYNPRIDVDNYSIQEEFTLYSFVNENDIKKYNVDGEKNDYNIKMIGYKVDYENTKKTLYTVLLPL